MDIPPVKMRISSRESLMMASHLLGTEEFDKNLEEFILEKTEGVPFFIEELIKSLKDLKIIERENNRYRITMDVNGVTIRTASHGQDRPENQPDPSGILLREKHCHFSRKLGLE
jgi:hypothetical protein